MVSKNNIEVKKRRLAKQVPHYGLRRLSVGVASVLLGTSFYLGGTVAHADTTAEVQPTIANTEENSNDSAGSLTFSTSTSGSSSNDKTIAAPTSTVSASAASNTSAEPTANTAANSADSSSSALALKAPVASSSAVSANNGSSASSSDSSTSSSANPATTEKINVNDLKQADSGMAAALNTNLTQTSDDTTVVKPSAPITDDSFKGQTLDGNKALVGTGKQASIQLSDGSSLSVDNNVIDPNKNTAILTFKSNSFKAGDSYQIVIDKEHGIKLSEADIAKLQPSFGTTVFNETADQYIITDHFINDGTISQAIKLSYDSDDIPWSFAKMTANVSVVKNSDSSSIKTLPVNVIASEITLGNEAFNTNNGAMAYNHHDVDLESLMYNEATNRYGFKCALQYYILDKAINTLTVQIAKLPQYFTATSCSINLDGTSISVPIINGKATFTREQLDKLPDINDYNNPTFAIHGRFDVPDNLFTQSKYIIESMDDGVTVNLAYKNNYGSLNSSTGFHGFIVLDGNAKLTIGDVFEYNQDYSAYFADNDYSKGGISSNTIPVIGDGDDAQNNKNSVSLSNGGVVSYRLSSNLADELHNVTWHISIPDGLNLTQITIKTDSQYQMIVTLRNGDQCLFTDTDSQFQSLYYKIASIDVTIPDFKGGDSMRLDLKPWNVQDLISNTYANGTPTQPGDLIIGSSTVSADGYGSATVDNNYIRLADHSVPNKKGMALTSSSFQTNKTPGALDCGTIAYDVGDVTEGSNSYDVYLKKPVFYIQVPENAVLQDLSKIAVTHRDGSDNQATLNPKSISLLTIGDHQFIKVDLSNYNVFNGGSLRITVPYSNASDIQSSSKPSPCLVVSDSLTDSEQDFKASHFDLNSTQDVDTPFKQLVNQEGINPANTAYARYGGFWDILTSDGMTSATMTKGNVASGPSMDSTQNDHKDQADTFNLYGSIIDATDQSIPSSVQVINVPTTSDGHSQFDTHLSGPIHVIDAVTGKNLDSLAKVTYSESAANLSASANGIPSNQLTADQVTDWSKIKSITIRMDVPKRTSARAVLTMKDPQIYDHVGKTIYVASTVFSDANDTSGTYHLKPITIAAGSAASAKLTVNGQSTVKTIVHYKDDKGDHYIELPDKAKTYNELQGTMNRSDFLQSASDLTDADRILLPAGMVLDYANPTIKNSSEKYLDNYQNGTAAFGQQVKYDFDQDAVVFEGAMPLKVTQTKKIKETIHYVYSDGSTAESDHNATVDFINLTGFQNPFTKAIDYVESSDSQTFAEVTSPKIPGYTPDYDSISAQTVTANDSDIIKTVTYTADDQKATVTYIDDTTGKTLKTTPLSGKTNAKSGYTTAQDIQAYKDLGYVLVSDDTNGAEITFDNDDKNDQTFAVHLKHDTVTVTPDKPGQPGTPINPGKGSASYPDGTDKAGLTD
ncbi:YSIRK-type signal peptide-containing protein, partial [Limosilactobacillus mucosae]